jgi:phage terminase small subunit
MAKAGVGRPSRPTALKVLHGARESRINRLEPVPSECEVRPATELSPTAAAAWNRLGPDLAAKGVLTAWDVDQFATFCPATATFYEASAQLAEHGMVA